MKEFKRRLDYKVIRKVIEPGSRVLDLGCGEGFLLALLTQERNIKGQGIELQEDLIYKCVEKGVSVFHGDIETGLKEYPDSSFDYVILNQSMQETVNVDYVIKEALRVGKKVIVGFPNFANIFSRITLFFRGKAPRTKALPYSWYDTPNLHFLSIDDFKDFCKAKQINILQFYPLGKKKVISFFPNLFALNTIFVINRA